MEEKTCVALKGRARALIRKKVEDGSIIESWTPWKSNRVVDQGGVLIAGLLSNDATFVGTGVLQFAIGEGDSGWDSGTPPTPPMTDTTLLAEFDRNAVDYSIYVEANPSPPPDYIPAVGRTAIIETRATFAFADGPTPGKWIREQALFGGDATSTTDSGLIFNIFRGAKIWKDETIELQLFFQHEVEIVAL